MRLFDEVDTHYALASVPTAGGRVTGEELRGWMAGHSYTATRLGSELGVAERTIYRWRRSKRVPAYLALALESLERRMAPEGQGNPEAENMFGGSALNLGDRQRLAG
jgi:hypothetical protein